MFIDCNNFTAGHIGRYSCKKKCICIYYIYSYIYIYTYVYVCKNEKKNHMETVFSPIILQRPPIITYGVPFSLCRTANHHHHHHHIPAHSFNNLYYCVAATTSYFHYTQVD